MSETSPKYYFNDLDNDFLYPEVFRDINFVWQALNKKEEVLEKMMEARIEGVVDTTVVIRGLVKIGEGSVIEPQVVIEGPVIIGKNCLLRPHSYIRAGTIISDNVVVGHGVEVKNSLIFNDCKLDSHSFVGDSILGRGVRNGSGSITANRRFDQKEIFVKIDGEVLASGFDKFGCVIGDYCRLGASCTVLPGTLIGQHVWVYPHSLIKGFIKSDSFVKTKQIQEIKSKERIILKHVDNSGKV